MNTDDVAAGVRSALAGAGEMREIKMFGGLGFLLNGNMIAAVSRRGLLLRVGKDGESEAFARPGSRPMEMRGRTMEGYVYVDPSVLTESAIKAWLQLAEDFVQTLPPKAPGSRPARTKGKRTSRA